MSSYSTSYRFEPVSHIFFFLEIQGLSDTKSESEISLHGPGLDASKDSKKSGLRTTDYLAIGISAGLLGLLYVAVLVVFLCYRRRRRRQNVHVKLTAPSSPLIEQGTIRMNPLLHSRPTLPSGSAMFTVSSISASFQLKNFKETNYMKNGSGFL